MPPERLRDELGAVCLSRPMLPDHLTMHVTCPYAAQFASGSTGICNDLEERLGPIPARAG